MDADKRIMNIENIEIPYDVVINNKLKYMRVSIDIRGMRVSMPKRMNIIDVERFLRSKENWILNHYKKFQSIRDKETGRVWEGIEKVLLNGREYDVSLSRCKGDRVSAKFDGVRFEVIAGEDLNQEDRKKTIELALKKVFVRIARKTISEKLAYYSNIIGVKFNDVRIKEQKTRWGSCSKRGNLNFNWKIIMAPSWVMDYVIIHELCHLRFLDHSKKFWDLVEGHMPQYKEARQWLKENGSKLRI